MLSTRRISTNVRLFWVLSTLSWFAVGCNPSPETQAIDLSVADEAAAETIREYQALSKSEPDNADHHGELGVVYELHGYMDAAIAEYDLALELDPSNPRWHYYRALLVANQEGLEFGLRGMDQVIELDDLYAPAWLWRGTWLLDLSRINEAEHAFARARDLGSYLPSKIGLARTKLKKGDSDGAIKEFEEMVAAYQLPYLRQLLGTAYLQAGQTVRAKEILTRVHGAPALRWRDPWVEAKAKFLSAGMDDKLESAQRLLQVGSRVKALESLKKLRIEHPRSTRVIHLLALTMRLQGDTEDAVRLLEQAIEEHPTHYAFYIELAEMLKSDHKLESALNYLQKALEADPNLVGALSLKGRIFMEQKKWREAKDAFMTALNVDDTDAALIVDAGWTNGMLNQWEEAAKLFQQAIFVERSYVPAYLNLARALALMGNFEDAENVLTQAIDVGASSEHVRVVRDQVNTIKGGSS